MSTSAAGDHWRPAESDRRVIAERLRHGVDEGRLDLGEYERRLRRSDTAATLAELHQLVFDLPPPAEPLLTTVGDIRLTASAAHTPTGAIPLRGATWHVHDQWWSERHIPTWAIVLAIVGFFCLTVLSLLFLLAKEDRTHGQAIVTVVNGDARYTTYVPVANGPQLQAVHQVVQYAQQLGTGHATG